MITVHTASDLAAVERHGRRAVVMTMGALHEGHLSLVRHAQQRADQVVVTIFVNPLQFNDPADLERYPRTLDQDARALEAEGVDVLFAPSAEEMYPGGRPQVTVAAGAVGEVLEGAHRPGHFDGMLTVVAKLLHLTAPDVAVFGAKDAQQAIAIRRMVHDLSMAVAIDVAPTVREADGLAMSSRNTHLSKDERDRALALSRALTAAAAAARNGAPLTDVLAEGRAVLMASAGVDVDYLAAMNPDTGAQLPAEYTGPCIVAVAARVGDTRLIDNELVRIGPFQDPHEEGDPQ